METRGIGVMAIQETHVTGSPYFTFEKYLVILSGGNGPREWAGVGFVVAPSLRHSVMAFTQHSPRLASLKIRVTGGTLVVISAYAPQSGRPPAERQDFFHELQEVHKNAKAHGATLILGDLNARIHHTSPDEDDIFGPHVFGNPAAIHTATGNREFLVETCRTLNLVVCNTRIAQPREKLVTYFNLKASPSSPLSYQSFAQLDLALIPATWEHVVHNVSDRSAAFQIHNYRAQRGIWFSYVTPLTTHSPLTHRTNRRR